MTALNELGIGWLRLGCDGLCSEVTETFGMEQLCQRLTEQWTAVTVDLKDPTLSGFER